MIIVASLLLICVGPASAQHVAQTQVFPIVAHTEGAGQPPTQWATDLVINNLTIRDVVVGMQFFPMGQANEIDPSFPNRVTLAVRETVMYEDVLASRFGFDQNITGMLVLTTDPLLMPGTTNTMNDRIVASTRTYNVGSPQGTFGQTVPSNQDLVNLFSSQSFVTGARNDGRFRSNLGIANFSLESVTVHFRIMMGVAQILVEGTRNLEALTVGQWSFSQLGVGQNEGAMTVDLWLDPSDVTPNGCEHPWPNMFMGYVSKVDGNPEGTGDAEFLYAAPSNHCD
jgi:hypothetical protein